MKVHPNVQEIQSWLVLKLAETLKIRPNQIDVSESFSTYGLDSAAAVCLAGDLEDWLDCSCPATIAYDYPSVELLAQHLAKSSSQIGNRF